MLDKANTPRTSPFDAIRKIDEQGREYWSARDMAKLLGYTQYNKFTGAIKEAEKACEESGQAISDHFTHTGEMVEIGSGAKRKFDTVYLSRYACYLIKEGGGTMPEDLPTPEKSIQQLQKEEQKRVECQQQPELPLFKESERQS